MTMPNAEEQALQAATTREPEPTKTPNTAPQKTRVAPGKGKSGEGQEGHQGHEGHQSRQEGIWLAEGEQGREGPRTSEAAEQHHARRTDESNLLASPKRPWVPVRNDWQENGFTAHVRKRRERRTNLLAQILSPAYSAPLAPRGLFPAALLLLEDP